MDTTITNRQIIEREKALWTIINAANLLSSNLQSIIDPLGLSISQYSLLNQLKMQSLSTHFLSESISTGTPKSEDLGNFLSLEALGLVKREEQLGNDNIVLTQKGIDTLNQIAFHKNEIEKYLTGLTEFELSIFNKMLNKLTTGTEQPIPSVIETQKEQTSSTPSSLKANVCPSGSAPMPIAEPRYRQ